MWNSKKCKNTILAKESHSGDWKLPSICDLCWLERSKINPSWMREWGTKSMRCVTPCYLRISLRSPSAEKHTNILPLPTHTLDTINSFVIFVLIWGVGIGYCRKTLSNTQAGEEKICLNPISLNLDHQISVIILLRSHLWIKNVTCHFSKQRARHPALSYCSHPACSPWGDSAWRKQDMGPGQLSEQQRNDFNEF